MKVEILAFCQHVSPDGGSISLHHLLDGVKLATIPFTLPSLHLVCRMRFDPLERGDKHVVLAIVNEDGQTVAGPIESRLTDRDASEQLQGFTHQIVFHLTHLTLHNYGTHEAKLLVNGRLEDTRYFFVQPLLG